MKQLMMSYIKEGQPENLEELYSAKPSLTDGPLAQDSLRQKKNACICCAAVASRAAISGGMDSQVSFRLSDLYIQKFELIKDVESAQNLMWEMLIDYARRVQQLKYHTENDSMLFHKCAVYISKNIYNHISTEDLAKATGYTRTYLCNQFKNKRASRFPDIFFRKKSWKPKGCCNLQINLYVILLHSFLFPHKATFRRYLKK